MPDKKSFVFSLVMLFATVVLLAGFMYAVTPQAVREPKLEHAHIRMQLIVNGSPVNFGDAKFQKHYEPFCSDNLSEDPIHFHDFKDQFVHLHWKGLTGGLILKNYGWNLIGGPNDTLGFRSDHLPFLNRVPIYGDVLPALAHGTPLWVYTGDEHQYVLHSTEDFLQQDVETFFGKKSTVNAQATNSFWRDLLFAPAAAHSDNGKVHTQEELTQINNLLGNVVIFTQKDKPTDAQVKDRFNQLAPLQASTCGG